MWIVTQLPYPNVVFFYQFFERYIFGATRNPEGIGTFKRTFSSIFFHLAPSGIFIRQMTGVDQNGLTWGADWVNERSNGKLTVDNGQLTRVPVSVIHSMTFHN